MAKKKSSLKNMVLTLLFTTLGAAVLLGVIYGVTKVTIEESKKSKMVEALSGVLGEFDNNPAQDTTTVMINGLPIVVYRAQKGGQPSGYAVSTLSKSGFSGEIKIMVGFKLDGEIIDIRVLEQNETPGLGSKMADKGNVLEVSFVGKNPAELKMRVKKDGGDIDAITASTISSRAYVEAVERAYEAFKAVSSGESVGESVGDCLKRILPEFEGTPEEKIIDIDGKSARGYVAKKEGQIVGYAVESTTNRAFHGEIKMLVGFRTDGVIEGIAVTEQNETVGFGAEIKDDGTPMWSSFVGKNPATMRRSLKMNGGDVDGLSGATITSYAYIDGVERAMETLEVLKKEIKEDE